MPNPGDDARRQLLARERSAQIRVIAEFKKIEKRLQAELYDLMLRIDKARRIDGNAPPSLLIKQARARDLLNQVSDEIFKTSQRLGLDTSNLQKAAVDIAQDQAGKYAALRSDLSFFDSASTRELIGIAGDGSPLAVHFARLREPVRAAMFDALFFGLATGASNQQIAREINQAVEGGAVNAMTIVRTETNRAYREATRKFYDDAPGVIGWRWVAALDLRTCVTCWALHGRIFTTKTPFGTHPNCRCTMVPVFEGDAPTETGPDKFAKLTLEQQRAILGPKRLELYNRGADLSDFVETYKSKFGVGRRIVPLDRVSFAENPRTPAASASGTPAAKTAIVTPPAASSAGNIKPGEPVPTFSTAADANEYFERRFPGTKFDFAGIDTGDGFMQAQANEIARLLDAYPEIKPRFAFFGTIGDKSKQIPVAGGPIGASDYADHNTWRDFRESAIRLNPKYFGDRAVFRERKIRNRSVGWSVSDADQSTVTHEFGHAVDYWLESNRSKSLLPFRDANGSAMIDTLKAKIVRKFKPTPGEQSDYSLKDKREQFAEGFSMFWNRPAGEHSRFTRAQARLIELVQSRKLYASTSAESPYLTSLSDAEQRAAKKQINELYDDLGLTPPFKKGEL